ncbi:hypothetical protein WG906_12330 [Pedobacter sp. P351]|uniref:hypothetical protein n=1 Tax=Pedobacter superstes TaxID=3133441 RepID=UPI0030B4E07E
MKKSFFKIVSPFVIMLLLAGCVKEENIFTMFDDVQITLHNNSPYSITDYKEVADGDSVYIDFTISSAKKDMYEVWLLETGQTAPSLKIPITDNSKRREFSYTIKLKADKRIGPTSYRVFPVDKELVYMGDGHKQVTIDVKSNLTFLTERYAFFPDSQQVKKCFLSLTSGQLFSYNEGKENESKIDLGVDTIFVLVPNTTPKRYDRKYVIFSPDALNKPLYSFYDMNSWNKRTTLFSVPETIAPFVNFKTGAQIVKAATPKINPGQKGPFQFTSGQMIYFKTQEGKYGALTATVINSFSKGGDYVEFQIKIAD